MHHAKQPNHVKISEDLSSNQGQVRKDSAIIEMLVNISFHFKVKLLKVSLSWLENFNILKSYFLRFEERRSPLALTDFSERRSRSRSLIFFRAPLALALAILGAPLASAAHRAALSNTLKLGMCE